MPLPPSRNDILGAPPRDGTDLRNLVRHHGSALRQLNQGMLGGRFATPRPVPNRPTDLVGDDGDSDGDAATVVGEDGDRHVCFGSGQQRFQLSYIPIDETVHLHWHASASSAGVEWKRGDHWDIDDAGVITIYSFTRGGATWPKAGGVFSAQYLRLVEEDEVNQDVHLGGFTLLAYAPAEIDTGIILADGQEYRIVMYGNYAIDGPYDPIPEFPPAGLWGGNPSFHEPEADSVIEWRRAGSESAQWVGRWGTSNPVQYSRSTTEGWIAWAAHPSSEFTYTGGWPMGDPGGASSDIIVGLGEELRLRFMDTPYDDNNGSISVEVYEV